MSITFSPAPIVTEREVIFDDMAPSINLSNSNAFMVLRQLGIEPDYAGSITPTDLLTAIATSDVMWDGGTVDAVSRGAAGATFIDCGVRPGYFKETFAELTEIARYAHARDLKVQWA